MLWRLVWCGKSERSRIALFLKAIQPCRPVDAWGFRPIICIPDNVVPMRAFMSRLRHSRIPGQRGATWNLPIFKTRACVGGQAWSRSRRSLDGLLQMNKWLLTSANRPPVRVSISAFCAWRHFGSALAALVRDRNDAIRLSAPDRLWISPSRSNGASARNAGDVLGPDLNRSESVGCHRQSGYPSL
jgi:hypothetical protein